MGAPHGSSDGHCVPFSILNFVDMLAAASDLCHLWSNIIMSKERRTSKHVCLWSSLAGSLAWFVPA